MVPRSSSEMPRRSAIHAAVTRTHSGSLRERGAPGGARNGESVSTSSRSSGTRAATSADASSPRRNTSPEKLTASPEVDHGPAVVERAGIEWMMAGGRSPNAAIHEASPTPAWRSSSSRASCASRRPSADRQWRIAGLAVSSASARFRRRFVELVGDGAEHAVVVETGLADRDDAVVPRAADDGSQPRLVHLRGVVWMDAGGRVEPGVAVRRARSLDRWSARSSPGRGSVPCRRAGRHRARARRRRRSDRR